MTCSILVHRPYIASASETRDRCQLLLPREAILNKKLRKSFIILKKRVHLTNFFLLIVSTPLVKSYVTQSIHNNATNTSYGILKLLRRCLLTGLGRCPRAGFEEHPRALSYSLMFRVLRSLVKHI